MDDFLCQELMTIYTYLGKCIGFSVSIEEELHNMGMQEQSQIKGMK